MWPCTQTPEVMSGRVCCKDMGRVPTKTANRGLEGGRSHAAVSWGDQNHEKTLRCEPGGKGFGSNLREEERIHF